MAGIMRSRTRLGWLEGRLWGLVLAAVAFFLYDSVGSLWHDHRLTPSLHYLRLSRAGRLTTATIEGSEGYVHPKVVYSYTTPDGVRRHGRYDRLDGARGDELPVFYLPGEPDLSVPLDRLFEFEQLAIAVVLASACAVSLVSWRIRARSVKA
jgi:hypothetical protein